MNINQRVRSIRKKLGMTQGQFGKRISVAQTSLSQIEVGDREVTNKVARLICHEFNVNESWLRTGEGDMFVEHDNTHIDHIIQEYGLDDIDRAILEEYVKMTDAERKVIKKYLHALSARYDSDPDEEDGDSDRELREQLLAAKAEQEAQEAREEEEQANIKRPSIS